MTGQWGAKATTSGLTIPISTTRIPDSVFTAFSTSSGEETTPERRDAPASLLTAVAPWLPKGWVTSLDQRPLKKSGLKKMTKASYRSTSFVRPRPLLSWRHRQTVGSRIRPLRPAASAPRRPQLARKTKPFKRSPPMGPPSTGSTRGTVIPGVLSREIGIWNHERALLFTHTDLIAWDSIPEVFRDSIFQMTLHRVEN
jgi:hypothetical protein